MPATTPTKAQKSPLASALMAAPGAGDAGASALCRAPSSPRSYDPRPAEEALRPHDQRRGEHDESDDGFVPGTAPPEKRRPRRDLHREPEQEAARQRAVGAADPAEDDRGEDRQ